MQSTVTYGTIPNGSAAPSPYPAGAAVLSNGTNGETASDVHTPTPDGSEDAGSLAGPSSGVNGYGHYVPPHNEQIVAHMFNVGFQMGEYADTTVHTQKTTWKLHALILSRSPYLAHLMSTSPKQGGIHSIYVPLESIPELTVEGFAIALGYLYSSVSLNSLTPGNARAVLAAGCLLGGMEDLCHIAYQTCRDSITLETLDEWLAFVDGLPTPDGGSGTPELSVLGQYAPRLRQDVLDFLFKLPSILEVHEPGSNGRETLLSIFSRLPFDLFKSTIEWPKFEIGSVQERFRFAKAAIDLRKRTRGGSVEETVVLAFGGAGSSGSTVHVTRKTKKRALFKVG